MQAVSTVLEITAALPSTKNIQIDPPRVQDSPSPSKF
jgi:hypothetical protein